MTTAERFEQAKYYLESGILSAEEAKVFLNGEKIMGEPSLFDRMRARVAHLFLIAFYFVTAWVPRRLPRNESEWLWLRFTLIDYFGVEDKPATWATVAGHVSSTPSYRRRRSFQYLANAAQRLTVNAAAQDFRKRAISELEEQLREAMAKTATEETAKEYVRP